MIRKMITCISILTIMAVLVMPCDTLFASNITEYSLDEGPEIFLDQYQETGSYETGVHNNIILAQSFTPSFSPLTKVEVKVNKPRKTDDSLVLSIRDSLNESDIVSMGIYGDDIPFFTNWIEFDIKDIDITVGKTYYIVLSSRTTSESPFRWTFNNSGIQDTYNKGKMYRYFKSGDMWEKIELDNEFADACFRTYSHISQTDLVCIGNFNWTNVQPAQDNLTGFFTVQNNGTPFSRLNWKIVTWPGWGTWTFSQKNGSNLRPEDGPITISIGIEAPHSNVPDDYDGRVLIVNEDDSNDTCSIYAHMETSKTKEKNEKQHILFDMISDFFIIYRENNIENNFINQPRSYFLFHILQNILYII
ncbi:MAG: hypothetical protein DRN27_06270 [Thermoplasmata archaeon]|nr:MAG: hypothetical protein DRN27_06270 [Thermoplasmata archaeon]